MNFTFKISKFCFLVVFGFYFIPSYSQNICNNPSITIAGPPQVVFQFSQNRCSAQDVPDSPAMAFINQNNQVVLFNGIAGSYPSLGQNLNQVKRVCNQPLFANNPDPNAPPEAFYNKTWLRDPWTKDGKTIYALVHNEFQGWSVNPGYYCPSMTHKLCWFPNIIAAKSTDGGKTFQLIRNSSGQSVLAMVTPYKYVPDGGQTGISQQSNIISQVSKDGTTYYYILIQSEVGRGHRTYTCLARNNDISNPSGWLAWDGQNFTIKMNATLYRNPNINPEDHICTRVLAHQVISWTYNTVLGQFLAVGSSPNGYVYMLSKDMVNWTQPTPFFTPDQGMQFRQQKYPSLLDPTSAGRNFEFSGAHPYIYYTQVHPWTAATRWYNRDLMRLPLNVSCNN